ncbi:MAG: phosphatase PAP2 family protein [Deltaproteobacteria bacterium]|nr:MAG: phosphatase PAP2 family protein [Deltaproteobacteria bacterium]
MKGIEIILWLQGLRSPGLDMVMLSISALGSSYAYMVMLPLAYWLMDRRRGWLLALVFLLSMQVNGVLKEFTETLRPFQVDARIALVGPKPLTYALPSGHAQGGLIMWGGLAAMRPSVLPATIYSSIIFLVGLTRLYLGVHSPLDVGAGWALGGLGLGVALLLFRLDEISPEIPKDWRVRLLWAIAGCGMIMLRPSKGTIPPGATLAAVAALEYWERTRIRFDDCRQLSQRIARLAGGLIPPAVLLGLYKYLGVESLWMTGIIFVVMGAWMVLGAPYLFKKLRI